MIIIYEKSDLSEMGTKRCYGIAPVTPKLSDVNPDLRCDQYADVVYVTNHDGTVAMVKARNGPLDPYPARIKVQRDISTLK